MKILFTGGGTIGSVSPLLAVKSEMEKQGIELRSAWVGSRTGVEVEVMAKEEILYYPVSSGKFRRYFSWRNFLDLFKVLAGFFQSISIIRKFKPDLVITAGSFVSVPVIWAAWFLRKKIIVHQQDLKTGLANKLMAPLADKITVSFEKSLKDFNKKKTILTGNPFRRDILSGSREKALELFNLQKDLPTVLIMGGSLGAERINQVTLDSISKLIKDCQIIHLSGKGNEVQWLNKKEFGDLAEHYHNYEYLYDRLKHAYAVADLVVCRAGLGTLTELSLLEKPAVVIPIARNQQEENAEYFSEKDAVITLSENNLSSEKFVELVKSLLRNSNSLKRLSRSIAQMMPKEVNEKYVQQIKKLYEGEK